MTTKEMVEFAASILDVDKPGWYDLIDLKLLVDLEDDKTCILGQVYGNWKDNHFRLFAGKGITGVTSYNPDFLVHWQQLIGSRQVGG